MYSLLDWRKVGSVHYFVFLLFQHLHGVGEELGLPVFVLVEFGSFGGAFVQTLVFPYMDDLVEFPDVGVPVADEFSIFANDGKSDFSKEFHIFPDFSRADGICTHFEKHNAVNL